MSEESKQPDSSWEDELVNKTLAIVKTQLSTWCEIIKTVGFSADVKKEWAETFINQIEGNCQAMVEETNAYQDELMEKIETSLEKCRSLCKDLHLIMPRFGSEKLTLLQEHEKLTKYIEECKVLHGKKCQEIKTLQDEELQLCKILGTDSKGLQDSPLPTNNEIGEFKQYLEQLESLKFVRLEQFLVTKSDILKFVHELKYQAKTDFEKLALFAEESSFQVSQENMEKLEQFYMTIKEIYNTTQIEILRLQQEVKNLWRFLNEDKDTCDLFLQTHVANNLEVMEAWKQELTRCGDIKKENIEVYIKCLRQELLVMYEKCHIAENNRDFQYVHSNFFTEDLLTLHEREMDKLQKYYNKNSELIHLLERREKLCKKLSVLQIKSSDPDRFKNRGGQLLQEEKERNVLKKSIPKLEEQLRALSSQFEISNKEAFLSWGKTVNEIIAMDSDKQNVLKSATKQHKKDATPATKTCNLVCKTASATKRNLVTPDCHQVKRRRILRENNANEPQSAPGKVMTNKTNIAKLVANRGIKTPTVQLPLDENQLLAYERFQSTIEEKENCRSTMVPQIIIEDH